MTRAEAKSVQAVRHLWATQDAALPSNLAKWPQKALDDLAWYLRQEKAEERERQGRRRRRS